MSTFSSLLAWPFAGAMVICTSSQRGGARGDHGLTPASSQRGEAMSTFSSLLAWPLALPFLDSGKGEA